MTKNRSAFLSYVLVALTGGIFAFVWAHLMMRDLNRLTDRKRIPAFAISMIVAVSYIAAVAAIAWDAQVDLPPNLSILVEWVGFVASLAAFGAFAVSIALIYREILTLSGKPFGAGPAILAGVGSLLGYIFLPYAQVLLNRLENRLAAPDLA